MDVNYWQKSRSVLRNYIITEKLYIKGLTITQEYSGMDVRMFILLRTNFKSIICRKAVLPNDLESTRASMV